MKMEDAMPETVMMGDVVRNDLVEYEALSVMQFRALDALTVREFAPPGPGVYALAHSAPHDDMRVQPPYFYGQTDNLLAALSGHLHESDPALARHEALGSRWFRVVYAAPDKLENMLEALKAQYAM
jgi:hypothetical protein